jgi:hypothetical protein
MHSIIINVNLVHFLIEQSHGATGQKRDQLLHQEPHDGHAEGCEPPLPHRLSRHGGRHVFQVKHAIRWET